MERVFHKLNYYALAACICAKEKLSCEQGLSRMGAKPPYKMTGAIPKNKKVFDKDLEDIKRLYLEERKDLVTIGKKYKCTGPAIANFLTENNITLRKRGRIKKI